MDRLLAETYDAVNATVRDPSGDRAFYAGLADTCGGPVLEIGCGTGRVLLPIAEAGHEVVGVDPSEAMLAIARRRLPAGATLVCGMAESLDLPRRDFALATFPFRSFMHLETPDDQLEALGRVHAHLRPGGWVALDVFEPKLESFAQDVQRGEMTFTWEGRQVLRKATITRDRVLQHNRVHFDFVDPETGEVLGSSSFVMRWTFRYELEHLLVRAGFTPLRWSSGFDGRPYEAEGDIVVVARRA